MAVTRLTRVHRVLMPAIYSRQISSTTSLSGRGSGGRLRSLGLEDEELENMATDELHGRPSHDLASFKENLSQIDVDAKRYQALLRYKTIEHKYFKKYLPKEENLMTWSMKEQLRYLHATDPDAWTPEVLSKAFPTSPEGARKLLKSKWVPRDEAAIQRHDKGVAARWKKHMKGQLGSARLIEAAFKKYSSQTAPVLAGNTEQMYATLQNLKFDAEEQLHTPKGLRPKNKLPNTARFKGGFLDIITKYEEQLKQRENTETTTKTAATREKNAADTEAKVEKSTAPAQGKAATRRDGNVPREEENTADLSHLAAASPTYPGSFTQVLTYTDTLTPREKSRGTKGKRKSKQMMKTMTFREFMKQKS